MTTLEQRAAQLIKPVNFHSSAPRPLPPKLPPVPPFDPELCPDSLWKWIMEHADALQVPPEFCAAPAVAALGGVIGRQLAIKVKYHEDELRSDLVYELT
jgi:hypothetical protein